MLNSGRDLSPCHGSTKLRWLLSVGSHWGKRMGPVYAHIQESLNRGHNSAWGSSLSREGLSYEHSGGSTPGSWDNSGLVLKGHLGSACATVTTLSLGCKSQEDTNDKDGQCTPAWHPLTSPVLPATVSPHRLLQPAGFPGVPYLIHRPYCLSEPWLRACFPPGNPALPTVSHSTQDPLFPAAPAHTPLLVCLQSWRPCTNHVTLWIPYISQFTVFMCISPDFNQWAPMGAGNWLSWKWREHLGREHAPFREQVVSGNSRKRDRHLPCSFTSSNYLHWPVPQSLHVCHLNQTQQREGNCKWRQKLKDNKIRAGHCKWRSRILALDREWAGLWVSLSLCVSNLELIHVLL